MDDEELDFKGNDRYEFLPLSMEEFLAKDYKREWLIPNLLVRGQPAVLAGPRKSLKTGIAVDLAISLASTTPFLGHFKPAKYSFVTALISGESGEATIQETARRIIASKGISTITYKELRARGLQGQVSLNGAVELLVDFKLPRLASKRDLEGLAEGIINSCAQVVIIDPLYLCLLDGQGDKGLQASNLFDMGPLLATVARACLDLDATPILVAHAKKTIGNPYEPMELEDISYSGIQEFARQWLLVNPRVQFQRGAKGEAFHRLWLGAGGSAGHGGLWALDVDEGILNEDFTGRKWDVKVADPFEARKERAEASQQRKRKKRERQDKDDGSVILAALDKHDPARQGMTTRKLRTHSGFNQDHLDRVLTALVKEGSVEEFDSAVAIGNRAKRSATCYRLPRVAVAKA
jgi:replicative DNA helicase